MARGCKEFALRPLHESAAANHPDPDQRPFCCAVPPYDMACKCDQSCATERGNHRCAKCGWTWKIVGHYTNVPHKKCEAALNQFAKLDRLPPGFVKTWCKTCTKKARWVAWIESVGPVPPTVPMPHGGAA